MVILIWYNKKLVFLSTTANNWACGTTMLRREGGRWEQYIITSILVYIQYQHFMRDIDMID
jgi:hypothetical protein